MTYTLFVVINGPLVDKSLKFQLYMVQNLPLLQPKFQKNLQYDLPGTYLSIRSYMRYITFHGEDDDDIFSCVISVGHFYIKIKCYFASGRPQNYSFHLV